MTPNPNPYTRQDALRVCEGAFTGLLADFNGKINIRRGGETFAIQASFPWLSFASALADTRYRGEEVEEYHQRWYRKARERYTEQKGKVTLWLPSPEATKFSEISVSAGLAGGFHEFGHYLCDDGDGEFPSYDSFKRKVAVHWKPEVAYHKAQPHQITNLLADMRLEPGFVLKYPHTAGRFHAIQAWVHGLEEEVRGTVLASDFKMCMRDLGKGWFDRASTEVYYEYAQEARDLVEATRPIWEVVRPTNQDWASTAHLPVSQMILLINELEDLLHNPDRQGGQGQGQGDGEPSEGQGQGQGQGDGEPSEGQGQGQGNGEPSEGQEKTYGNQGLSRDAIEALLNGEGEAHDPSSAHSAGVTKGKKNLGHTPYIKNGNPVSYRKLKF